MKKLLALVLALVMTLSLCTISNAAFTDAKDVDASYEEAVAVLNGMGVFKGYEDGSFKPEGSITRAEVAAIVYRLYTGDVKDKQAGLYAGYGKFDDMAGATWAAGYIGFCANAGFVKGYGNGKFGPSDPVTGYQALAMILRAVGYGKNGEFEGADWELHVAQIAQQVGALKNVKGVSLKAAASRQLVAELLFQVAAYVPTVTYTPAFGYVTADIAKDVKDETLGWKNFYLAKSDDGEDAWGRPNYKWFEDKNGNEKVDSKETKYATIKAKPVVTYTEAVTYCDICEDLGESKKAEVESVWTNGVKANHAALSATATKAVMGAQGELIEVYEMDDEYRFVVIDTYLAKVTDVKDAKLDSAGHVKAEAKLTLEVYGHADVDDLVFEGEDGENFDYEEDEYVLVYVNDAKLANSKIVEVVEPTVMSYTGISYKEDEIKLDGEWIKFACKYAEDEDALADFAKLQIFTDLYGNVIGTLEVDAEETVVVIDTMYTDTVKGKSTFYSELVGTDAEIDEFVIDELSYIDGVDNDGKPTYDTLEVEDIYEKESINKEEYEEVYDKLFKYTVNDDDTLKLVAVDDSIIGSDVETYIGDKDRYIYYNDANDREGRVKFNDETIFLVHENDGTYTSTTGADMEDLTAENVEIIVNDDGYATVVYLFGDIFRTSDVNKVYVPIQDVKKIVNQKVDGKTVKCLEVTVVPADGSEKYTAYLPLELVLQILERGQGDSNLLTEIERALAIGTTAALEGFDVEIGGFFLGAVFFKDTTVFVEGAELDYTPEYIKGVSKNTVVLDDDDETAFNLNRVDSIYVIENGEISDGTTADVKKNTWVHVFWEDGIVDTLYIDLDLTDWYDEFTEEAGELYAAAEAAEDANDVAEGKLTDAEQALATAQANADDADAEELAQELEAAKGAAAIALEEYKEALAGEDEDAIAAAKEKLDRMNAAVDAAQEAYDDAVAADAALVAAQAAYDAAEAAAAKTADALEAAEEALDDYLKQNILLPYMILGF